MTVAAARSRTVAAVCAFVLTAVLVPPAGPAAAQADEGCPEGGVPSSGFVDVAGNVHEFNIDCVAWHGVAHGVTATEYAPAQGVTRGQMASFIARLIEAAGVDLGAPSPQGFADIGDSVHADRINQLAAHGIVEGTSATTYAPRAMVRRDHMASFLVSAVEFVEGDALPEGTTRFTDIAGNVHETNIAKAATADLAQGVTATTYAPADDVRRDQMTSFLAGAIDLLGVTHDGDDPTAAAAVQDMWLFADIRTVDEGGGEDSILADIIDEVDGRTGEPVPLADEVTFTPIPSLEGHFGGPDGTVRDDVDVTFGLFEIASVPSGSPVPDDAVGERAFGLVSTAEVGATNVAAGDVLFLDPAQLGPLDGADTVLVDFGFGQALPRDDADEEDLSPMDTLAGRWQAGTVRWQGRATDGEMGPALHVGVPGRMFDDVTTADAGDAAAASNGGLLGIPLKDGMFGTGDAVLTALCIAGAIVITGGAGVAFAVMCVGVGAVTAFSSVQDAINDNGPSPPPCTGSCGGLGGDPHLTTFDGHSYDLHPQGELVVVDGGEDLQVQSRMGPVGNTRTLAWNTAMAVDVDGDVVVVDASRGAPVTVTVNGTTRDLATYELIDLPGGGELHRAGNAVQVRWEDGSAASATVWDDSLDIVVGLADDRAGSVRGLLGDADGDDANDLTTADGRTLSDPSFDELYDEYAESWRVDEAASLFDTPLTHDRSFPERRASADDFGADRRARAETICTAAGLTDPSLSDCVIDVAATGDAWFALRAVLSQGLFRPDTFDWPDQPDLPDVDGPGGDWPACFTDAGGDARDGENQPADDAEARRADIVVYCVDFAAGEARFALRVADPVDPRDDPNWNGVHSELTWDVTPDGDQREDRFVDAPAEAPYLVRYFRAGPDGAALRTTLEEPEGGGYLCDGDATVEDGWLVSTFRVADDSACFAGEDRLAVAPAVVYDVDPDGEADSPRLRVDTAPNEGGYRGFVTRGEDADGGGEPVTELASVGHDGTQSSEESGPGVISDDGRFVAFISGGHNLVPDDTNGAEDVFVRDRDTGQTERVSVASDGSQANDHSFAPAISADGRYVAFATNADNLVAGDTNDAADVFVHDRGTGETERVSVAHDGAEGDGPSSGPALSADGSVVAFTSFAGNLIEGGAGNAGVYVRDRDAGDTERVSTAADGGDADEHSTDHPAISADGRHVAFASEASNLVDDDTNGQRDIFVRDRQEEETERVNVAGDGSESEGFTFNQTPAISADGSVVAFDSHADDLVAGDTNNVQDVFVRDRDGGTTTRVSVADDGTEANAASVVPAISSDGRLVAFSSDADNLVADDTNGVGDVFVRDREAGSTTLISVADDGSQGDGLSFGPTMSADGRSVAFFSRAENLVEGDTNGVGDVFVRDRAGVGAGP